MAKLKADLLHSMKCDPYDSMTSISTEHYADMKFAPLDGMSKIHLLYNVAKYGIHDHRNIELRENEALRASILQSIATILQKISTDSSEYCAKYYNAITHLLSIKIPVNVMLHYDRTTLVSVYEVILKNIRVNIQTFEEDGGKNAVNCKNISNVHEKNR